MPLDKQINIISIDTNNFYSNHECYLHWLNHVIRIERKELVQKRKELESQLSEYGINKSDLNSILKHEYDFSSFKEDNTPLSLSEQYCKIQELVNIKNKKIKSTKEKLLKLLSNKVEANISSNGKHHIRELRNLTPANPDRKNICKRANEPFGDKNIISVFESSFTRMIGAKQDELSEDFMVIQIYYFDIAKDLIYNGFIYKGEKYIYFTSSAGQIRTKKAVFVKESIWNKYEKTIMCGLTIDKINEKGGNNPNKHLSYMALNSSATDVWEEFDIDKTIVIDDFETNVYGTYDLVNDEDYSIKRTSGYVPITHTDGAGMILPNAFNNIQCNKMIRLPWVKGLLGIFNYVKFIKENNCSSVIKDIYGKEHDVIAEDIQVIFTKSQFKMWKYYNSWEQYKEYYKKYNCTAGYTNPEEDRIKDASINYQMLQTLTDITDDEIDTIISRSNSKLSNLCSSISSMKNAFGITPFNNNMTYLQQAVNLYPDLMNDEFMKITLRDIKNSMVKRYKSGSLSIYGKYTFLLPDFYAACEYWFMRNKNPDGLLNDGEVFCSLFKKSEKLDCLRSPHLYREHAIRINTAYKNNEKYNDLNKWFCTKAIYTSCKDMISKILMFDVDGDKSLVVADKTIISVAERNMKDIVPLYYNMRKALPVKLNNESIYHGLNMAFTGSSIGQYSNNITKIWNSETFISGTDEEKQKAIDTIKLLCMENNFVIDKAKTLYMPERPEFAKELISSLTKCNVPHFFIYAKDKENYQVEDTNNSFVNKLDNKIINPRINCRSIGLKPIDYTKLVSNSDIECKVSFDKNGKINKELTDPMIVKYCELNQQYHYKINMKRIDNLRNDLLTNTQLKQSLLFNKISKEIKFELSKFGYSDSEISDILVKFLYHVKPSKHKSVLWFCYGEEIVKNLKKHFKPKTKFVQCIDCGEWFETDIKNKRTCRCDNCSIEHKRELTRLRVKKHRNK